MMESNFEPSNFEPSDVEPWLRGTHRDIEPAARAVLHALELAEEDVRRWVFALTEDQLALRPFGLPSAAFQVRHIARSIDRLLTYAEGSPLSVAQLTRLATEQAHEVDAVALRMEFEETLAFAVPRLLRFDLSMYTEARTVGRASLPTTVAGLLIHIAEHTQRHVGQAITTAKLVAALHGTEQS